MFDLYQEITGQIVSMLDKGVVPWRNPILGRGTAGQPMNLESGKAYRGVNVFLLAVKAFSHGYESSYWVTFNQAKSKGGSVRKGEKSTMVVFWKQHLVDDEKTGKPKTIPVLRYFNVFNVAQCEGIKAPDAATYTPIDFKPLDMADAIVKSFVNPPAIEHGGNQAIYRPAVDLVRLPEPTRFTSGEEYYSVLFHEMAHSTGHNKRLDRKLDTEPKPFGSSDYGREELIAEMASAFLCGHAGIKLAVIENQASYIGGWLKTIRSDKRLVIVAAGAAQRASDYVRGVKANQELGECRETN
jgi:antirestriction protein ArdC